MGDQVPSAILSCNKVAMAHFRLHRLGPSQQLLHRAFALLPLISNEPLRDKLRVITLNNLGCLYGSARPEIAVKHLEEALGLELKAEERVQAAGTCLNLSAIRAQSGLHGEALRLACVALELLKINSKKATGSGDVALAIAHHNVGVEYEVLGKPEEAVQAYRQGFEEAKVKLGEHHQVTAALAKSLNALRKPATPTPPPHTNSPQYQRPSTPSFPLIPKSPQLIPIASSFSRMTKKNSLSPVSFAHKIRGRSSPKLYISPEIKAKNRLGRRVSEGRAAGLATPTYRHSSFSTHDIERKASKAIEELEHLKRKARADCQLSSLPNSSPTHSPGRRLQRSRRQRCVLFLQAILRGYLARRKHVLYLKSALIIQRYVRGFQVCHLYLKICSAIIYIQRAWRRYRVRAQSGKTAQKGLQKS